MKIFNSVLALALLAFAGPLLAQSFTVNPAAGPAGFRPTATYTVPDGGSCAATGAWTATKTVSGTEVLPAVNASGVITWTCRAATGRANLSWTVPTTNEDGSPIGTIYAYDIYSGTNPTTPTYTSNVLAPATSVTLTLPPGMRYFSIRTSVGTAAGPWLHSQWFSPIVSKNVVADLLPAVTAPLTVTAAPNPNPPGNLTVTQPLAYSLKADWPTLAFTRVAPVGTVAIGTPCRTPRTSDGLNAIDRARVRWTGTSRPTYVAAQCG